MAYELGLSFLKTKNTASCINALLRCHLFHIFMSSRLLCCQIQLMLSIDTNVNTIIEIRIQNYLYTQTFNFICYCLSRILVISCFRCLQNDDVIEFD